MTILKKYLVFTFLICAPVIIGAADTNPKSWHYDSEFEKKIHDAIPNKINDSLEITDIHAHNNMLYITGTVLASTGLLPGILGLTGSLIQYGAEEHIALLQYDPREKIFHSAQRYKRPDHASKAKPSVTIIANEPVIVIQDSPTKHSSYVPHAHKLHEKKYANVTIFDSLLGSSCAEYFVCGTQGSFLNESKDKPLKFYSYRIAGATPVPHSLIDEPDFWALDNQQNLYTVIAHHSTRGIPVESTSYRPLNMNARYIITDLAIYDKDHACALGIPNVAKESVPELLLLKLESAHMGYTINQLECPPLRVLKIATCREKNGDVVYALTHAEGFKNALYKTSLKMLTAEPIVTAPPVRQEEIFINAPRTLLEPLPTPTKTTESIIEKRRIGVKSFFEAMKPRSKQLISTLSNEERTRLLQQAKQKEIEETPPTGSISVPTKSKAPEAKLALSKPEKDDGNNQTTYHQLSVPQVAKNRKKIIIMDKDSNKPQSSQRKIIFDLDQNPDEVDDFAFKENDNTPFSLFLKLPSLLLNPQAEIVDAYQHDNIVIVIAKQNNHRLEVYSRTLKKIPGESWKLKNTIPISSINPAVTTQKAFMTDNEYEIEIQGEGHNYSERYSITVKPESIQPKTLWGYIKEFAEDRVIKPSSNFLSGLNKRIQYLFSQLFDRR